MGKFADFKTFDIDNKPEFEFFQTSERLVFLGGWTFGLDAELNRAYPLYEQPAPGDKRALQDATKANGILATGPRKCLDAFTAARQNNIFMLKEAQRLTGLGYTRSALVDGISKKATAASDELDLLSAQLVAEQHRLTELQSHIENTYLLTGESELQQVMYDLKIGDRLACITHIDIGQINQGALPSRFTERVVSALSRLPGAIHGIDSTVYTQIMKLHAKLAWPRSAHVIDQVGEMVQAAAMAVCSALVTVEGLSGLPAGYLFKQIRGGDWLTTLRNGVACDTVDFNKVKQAMGKPNPIDCVVQDAPE